MNNLIIKDLCVDIDEREILKDINLEFCKGQIIAIMGPNGNGKSTLLKSIVKHYKTTITKGDILIDNESILDIDTDEIIKKGIFYAPQHSQEIDGVKFIDFLKAMVNARRKDPIPFMELFKKTEEYLKELNLDRNILNRFLNVGFSGGEKKKCEILQMLLCDPEFVILDEIDSGLDIDSLYDVTSILKKWHNNSKTIIIISHQEKIYEILKPHVVHVIQDGKVTLTGDELLVKKINTDGYSWIKKEK